MKRKVVAMAAIPGRIERGDQVRTSLDYACYSQATWRWWCSRNSIDFVVIDRPQGTDEIQEMPPNIQRWAAMKWILEEYGQDAEIAAVDADTMIRWDAPDPFAVSRRGFGAVRDWYFPWIYPSIRAYRPLFPHVHLPWWEYFNSGLLIFGAPELQFMNAFVEFCREHHDELLRIRRSGNFGIDQTPLNFFLRQAGAEVTLLPPVFNLLHCIPINLDIWNYELSVDGAAFPDKVFSEPDFFDFIEIGYVWHFTNVVASRKRVMEETWLRIRNHYAGATLQTVS